MTTKPHIYRYNPDTVVYQNADDTINRYDLMNCNGETRFVFVRNTPEQAAAIAARIEGHTHIQGEPCKDYDGTDYFIHPLSVNTQSLFGDLSFGKVECYACKKDPSLRSPERRATGEFFREFAEHRTEVKKAAVMLSGLILRNYGRQKGGDYITRADRAKAAKEFLTIIKTE